MTRRHVGDDAAHQRRGAFLSSARAFSIAALGLLLTAGVVTDVAAQVGAAPATSAKRNEHQDLDPFDHAYEFEPGNDRPDDIPPWARSGLTLSAGVGGQHAQLGGQLSYEWVAPSALLVLAPYASAGVWPGGKGFHARPAFALGAMGMYGRQHRWLLDLGYQPYAMQGFRFGGETAAERLTYGATIAVGRQWLGRSGVFVRALIGATFSTDPYVPFDTYLALTLALGWKP